MSLLTDKMNCGYAQSQRSDQLRAIIFSAVVTRGTQTRECRQSPCYISWHSQACWGYGSIAFRGWENQRPPPSRVRRLPWQQHDYQKSARVWDTHRLKSSLCLLSCEELETSAETSLACVDNSPFERQRIASSLTLSTLNFHINSPFKLEKMLQAILASS